MKKYLYAFLAFSSISAFAQNTGRSPWTGASVPSSTATPSVTTPAPQMGSPSPNPNMGSPSPVSMQSGNVNQGYNPGFNPNQYFQNNNPTGQFPDSSATMPELIELPVKIIGKLNGKLLYRSTDGRTYLVKSLKEKNVLITPKIDSSPSVNSAGAVGPNGGSVQRPPDLPNSVGNVNIRR